ncbi:hypothetical protein V8J88_08480 [Massilia sp. W12]|uniref:hypothetical protein n=1 Tax=Massilia sp. W12 TaxID=3126507 RepID=UPI0030D1A72F
MAEEDYCYHLTTKGSALRIKENGMSSAYERTKTYEANPNGAFITNRNAKYAGGLENRLKRNLMYACAANKTLSKTKLKEIKTFLAQVAQWDENGINLYYVPAFRENDREKLDDMESQTLDVLCKKKLGDDYKAVESDGKLVPYFRNSDLATTATLLLNSPQHVLTRLARQHTDAYYRIEEIQTCSHIYFSKPGQAVSNYASYKKDIGESGDKLVILRVLIKDLIQPMQDPSDANAIRTRFAVDPKFIMVVEDHENFPDKEWRTDEKNWKALSSLSE